MTDTTLIDVVPGSRQPGRVQFIRQLLAKPDTPLDVVLPGVVQRCGDAVAHSLLPYARIVLPGDAPHRAALVTAGVADETELTAALHRLTGKIGTDKPLGFAVLITSRRSAGDIVGLAEDAIGGCGCDGGAGATVPGAISVGLSAKTGGRLSWSDPVAARIKAGVDDKHSYGPWKPSDNFVGLFFDCDAQWYGLFKRCTVCVDDGCAANGLDCVCDGPNGTWSTFCPGWCICWCW